ATSDANFISFSPGGGAGNGAIDFIVAPNSDSLSRRGTISVAGQSFTVLQGAKFNDVPLSHPLYAEISLLSAHGITAGCGGGNYCPETEVTREQMAIFIERALGVFAPQTPTKQRFLDVEPTRAGYAF